MTSFWQWRYVLFMALPVFWTLLMSSKICNNTSNKGLSHYFSKKTVDYSQRENLKVKQKNWFLNDDVIKNNAKVIILITWLISRFLLKSKNVLYEVSSDLSEVNSFYSSFPEADQKAPPAFQKFEKVCLV